jgi:hypothetical protein
MWTILIEAADRWTVTADHWDSTFAEVHQQVHVVAWEGAGADAARDRVTVDKAYVASKGDQLREAASVARRGAGDISAAQRRVLYVVEDAQNATFRVGEDLSVTDKLNVRNSAVRAARQAQAQAFAADIRRRAIELAALDAEVAANITAAAGDVGIPAFATSGTGKIQTTGFEAKEDPPPTPPHTPDPADPFMNDPRFGHWEDVPPPPPYTGSPPPPQPQYRPYPDGTPLKVGPTTGMSTPGKTWIADSDAPAAQAQEEYRFKLAGQQATTVTRTVYDNGHWQQQRWVQNVYEYQRNTSMVFGGDVGMKGIEGEQGDIGGFPPIQNIDQHWKPISLSQIATLSGGNAGTTYYLPDGCGSSVTFAGGVPQDSSVLPPKSPIMTAPR